MTRTGAAAVVLLDLDDRAHRDRAAAGAVGVLDAVGADDQALGREVRSLDALEQRLEQLLVATPSGWSRCHCTPDATSRRLCGGMLVAMPTAMPPEPLTSRLGNRAGQDRAAPAAGRRSWARSRRCPGRCRAPSPSPAAPAGTRCSAWRLGGRRRASRSCPGSARAGSAATTAGRGAPTCRRSRCRRAGGTDPSRHRRRGSTWRSRGPAGSRRRTSRRARGGAPA